VPLAHEFASVRVKVEWDTEVHTRVDEGGWVAVSFVYMHHAPEEIYDLAPFVQDVLDFADRANFSQVLTRAKFAHVLRTIPHAQRIEIVQRHPHG